MRYNWREQNAISQRKGGDALDTMTIILVVVCVVVMGAAAVMSYRR